MIAAAKAGPVLLAAMLAASGAPAQVQVEVLPDGTKLIHNRGSAARVLAAATPSLGFGRRLGEEELVPIVRRHARRQRLDESLISAIITAESSADPRAVSRRGAMGLMQLMPETAELLAVGDPFDPEENVRGGATYLRRLLDRFGRLDLALAAYNAGPEAVERFGGLPPYRETRSYVERVLRLYGGEPDLLPPPAAPAARRGRPTFLVRGADGGLVMTTTPPSP